MPQVNYQIVNYNGIVFANPQDAATDALFNALRAQLRSALEAFGLYTGAGDPVDEVANSVSGTLPSEVMATLSPNALGPVTTQAFINAAGYAKANQGAITSEDNKVLIATDWTSATSALAAGGYQITQDLQVWQKQGSLPGPITSVAIAPQAQPAAKTGVLATIMGWSTKKKVVVGAVTLGAIYLLVKEA